MKDNLLNKIESLNHGILIGILLAAAYVFLMFGNSVVTLTHPDEVFYAQTAKEMMAHHDFLTPYIFDVPQFEKPILFYWLLVAAFKVMGITAFAARFSPAIFGILGVVVTYWMAWMLFRSKKTAFFSSVILMTSGIHLAMSRAVLTDMVFSILVVISLAFFYWGYVQPRRRGWGILGGFVFSAFAVLTKGLLGIVFPWGIFFLFLASQRRPDYLKHAATFWGLVLFLLIAAPWHMIMFKLYGQGFLHEYWNNVHVRRIIDAEHPKSDTWYFYPGVMFGGIFPWCVLWIPALGLVWQNLRNRKVYSSQILFLVTWIIFTVAVMQTAHSKLASYILPVFPAVAILLAHSFSMLVQNSSASKRGALAVVAYVMAGVLVAVSIGAFFAGRHYETFLVHLGPIYLFSILALVCAAAILFFALRREYLKMFLSMGSITFAILTCLYFGYSYAEPWVSCKQITDVLNKIDSSQSTILCSKFYVRGVRYYTDRDIAAIDINGEGFFSPHPIPFLNTEGKVREFLNSQPQTYCVLRKGNLKDLKHIAGTDFSIEEIDEIGGKYLVRVKKL